YSASKAELNMMICKWGGTLKFVGICMAVVHPGSWISTTEIVDRIDLERMAKYAPKVPKQTAEESAAGVIKVPDALSIDKTASFFSYDGSTLAW
ncbi:hypothetical protein BJ878DRAFT_410825, partial [Calycina marina]